MPNKEIFFNPHDLTYAWTDISFTTFDESLLNISFFSTFFLFEIKNLYVACIYKHSMKYICRVHMQMWLIKSVKWVALKHNNDFSSNWSKSYFKDCSIETPFWEAVGLELGPLDVKNCW